MQDDFANKIFVTKKEISFPGNTFLNCNIFAEAKKIVDACKLYQKSKLHITKNHVNLDIETTNHNAQLNRVETDATN